MAKELSADTVDDSLARAAAKLAANAYLLNHPASPAAQPEWLSSLKTHAASVSRRRR